jgi:2-C-methyl-D-erythritol 4-phosphate cytidylyltransferase
MARGTVLAAILAAGRGERVGAAMPKQYLPLGGVPMLRRAADAFLLHRDIDRVAVFCPPDWLEQTQSLFADTPAEVLIGGETRTATLALVIDYAQALFGDDADGILLTHDGARPFVSAKIITENIAAARVHDACGTYLACADSLVRGTDGFVNAAISRENIYRAQTPQTFRACELAHHFAALTDAQKSTLTDACGVFTLVGEPIFMVPGEPANFKITTAADLHMAEKIAAGGT